MSGNNNRQQPKPQQKPAAQEVKDETTNATPASGTEPAAPATGADEANTPPVKDEAGLSAEDRAAIDAEEQRLAEEAAAAAAKAEEERLAAEAKAAEEKAAAEKAEAEEKRLADEAAAAKQEEPVAEVAAPTPYEKVLTHIQTLFPNIKELTLKDKTLIDSLEIYISSMAFNQVVDQGTGSIRQRRMYHDILSALQSENWTIQAEIVLYYFATFRESHFQSRLLNRFVDTIGLQSRDRLRFEALMKLFRVGGDVKSRALISKEIDFGALTGMFTDNNIKERLLAIFKIQ